MHCPNNNTLVAMLERALDPAVLPELEAHFGGCGACQQVVAALAGSREVSAPSSAATEPEAVIGTTINARYEMKSLLGRGGMGTVYLARDLTLGRDVALKLHRRGSHRERLHREAVAMAKLAHPNVVTVFEIANVDDRLYVAMEYVRGTTLRGWLRAARRSWREIVAMFVQVGAGLVAAHDAGLIHRDFKPENVLVGEDGRARVSDFGLVQFDGAPHEIDADDHVRGEWWPSSGSTQTGALVGTPAYMAPEQLNGHPADARSDQYGFCVTLYEALYRARPSLEGELTFPDDVAPRVPKFLRAIVARGLRTQPSDRFASMVELLAALQVDPTRRRKRVAIVVGGLIAAGAIALGVHAVSSESGAMCQLGDEQFAARWNPERRQAIAAAFAASGVPYAPHAVERVTAMFDRYGERWSEMYRASCEATHVRGDQSEAVLDLRTECLEDRLRAVDALAHALATADRSVVTTAVQAVSELPDIESCGDVARLKSILPPPRDMATRRKVRELEEQLTKARAFEGLARYADAEGIVTPALQQARELGYRPLEARALLLAADIAGGREDATAKTLYQEAVFAGQAGGDLEIVARAAVGLMLAAYVPGRLEDVELWNKMAEAATLRLGEPPHLVIPRWLYMCQMLRGEHRYADARKYGERALALLEHQSQDTRDTYAGQAQAMLGYVLNEQGDYAAAEPYLRGALEASRRTNGNEHPHTVVALITLASTLGGQGRYKEALVLNQEALAIRERMYGANHPAVARALSVVGTTQLSLGDIDAAQAALSRAVSISEATGEPDPVLVYNLAGIELKRGKLADAAQVARRGLAVVDRRKMGDPMLARMWMLIGEIEQARGKPDAAVEANVKAVTLLDRPEHADLSDALALALHGAGRAYTAANKPRVALPLLERAIRVFESRPASVEASGWIAKIKFAIAQARWALGEHPRAIQEAQVARAALASVGDPDLPEIDRWLGAR